MSDKVKLTKIWRENPIIFARQALGFEPDKWQAEMLNALRDNPRVAVKSGQGVGKTGTTSVAILWFLRCHYQAKIFCTAPTLKQLIDVMWSELAKWLKGSMIEDEIRYLKTKVEVIDDEETWFAAIRTANKPENMQGIHADNLLFIIDEGSGVPDNIFEVINGTLSGVNNKWLVLGNPTKSTGAFYDIFHSDSHLWYCMTVSSRDTKRTNKENIAALESKHGKDSDVVRVRVDGLFPKGASDTIIPLELIEYALEKQTQSVDMVRVNAHEILDVGVDVARKGKDRSTVCVARLNYVYGISEYNQLLTTQLTGAVINELKRYLGRLKGIKIVNIKVDETGVGGGVVDNLAEQAEGLSQNLGIKINVFGVYNNATAESTTQYVNLVSEMWGDMSDILSRNFFQDNRFALIHLPNIKELKSELSDRKFSFDSKGRIRLESKDDLEARGKRSPDYADSLMLAMYRPPQAIAEISRSYR